MYNIVVMPGDGIGPEIMTSACRVLKHMSQKYDIAITLQEALIGGAAIDVYGHPFPKISQAMVDTADAVLLGAVGGPKWDASPVRPEQGLLSLRKHMKTYCNYRPVIGFDALKALSPLKAPGKVDLCFVRELTGGIYFGDKTTVEDQGTIIAKDVMIYEKREIERIAIKAFELAKMTGGSVISVDKSNVLDSSKLWRKTVNEINHDYGVDLEHMYVDNAAMQLILKPDQFDIILTSNMFGDILSDEASVLAGSIGVLPSVSIGDGIGLFEPIHGSAPDIAGQDLANPIGMILSVGEMFRHTFNREDLYQIILNGVQATLDDGYGTLDLSLPRCLTTSEWTEKLITNI